MPPFLLACGKHTLSACRVLWTCARGSTAIPTLLAAASCGGMLWGRGLQAGVHGPHLVYPLFRYSPWAKNGLPILNLLNKTVKRRIMLHDMWKLYDAWISVSVNEVLLAPSYRHLFPYCLWLLLRYSGRVGVVEMEIQMEWSTKSHIFPIGSFPGKLCRLLIKRIEFQWLKANLSYLSLH